MDALLPEAREGVYYLRQHMGQPAIADMIVEAIEYNAGHPRPAYSGFHEAGWAT
jgi:hypothetical protein